jgi:hypothetical protein
VRAGEHAAHVGEILLEAALDLRQRLRVEVKVMDGDSALLENERAALTPSNRRSDRSEPHVELNGHIKQTLV